MGAFFIVGLWLLASLGVADSADSLPASCLPAQALGGLERVHSQTVLDGDTLVLEDGRRIRLVGVNTPEVAHPPRPAEPLAEDARRLLLQRATGSLFLQVGTPAQDHYGRTLAHLFAADGRNISAELLRRGAGFQVAIPPNLAHADCYAAAQAQARQAAAGIWSHPYFAAIPADSGRLRGGYQRVLGKVEKVTLTTQTVWIDLAGDLTLKLSRRQRSHLAGETFDRIVAASRADAGAGGLTLEVRGWLVDRRQWGAGMQRQIESGRRKRFQLSVTHRSQWQMLDP